MKKTSLLLLSLLIILMIFVGCPQPEKSPETEKPGTETPSPTTPTTPTSYDYLKFTLIEDNSAYEVSFANTKNAYTVNIPSTYEGKPVTRIATEGFSLNSTIKKVILPNSIKSIGEKAFYDCPRLEEVTFSETDNNCIIESNAFSECKNLKTVTIAEGVTSIGEKAFYNCENLNIEKLPSTLLSIEKSSFEKCAKLNVDIPSSVTSIGESAFSSCKSLTTITVPNGITSIEKFTFYGCESITTLTLPNGLTSIGFGAFHG